MAQTSLLLCKQGVAGSIPATSTKSCNGFEQVAINSGGVLQGALQVLPKLFGWHGVEEPLRRVFIKLLGRSSFLFRSWMNVTHRHQNACVFL